SQYGSAVAQRPDPRGASFAYQVAERNLDEQLARIEALDAKAGILIAADGVLSGLLFSRSSVLFTMPRLVAAVAVTLVGASLFMALVAFANRRYEQGLQIRAVLGLMAFGEEWLKWRFLGNLELALEHNDIKLRWKVRWVSSALFALMAGVGILVGYFAYDMLTQAGS
ncbi:MAG: hypothetical protein ACRD1T_18585, partial [Acidimicrobiia bacterium]